MLRHLRTSRRSAAGFSLVELMVVMAVVAVLLGVLLPSLRSVRMTTYRVISAGNQRTLGQGLTMWAGAHKGKLPPSRVLEEEGRDADLGELMRVYAPRVAESDDGLVVAQRQKHPGYELALDELHWHGWDGLGHLFASGLVKAPEVFYSPAHWGEHPYRRYQEDWIPPDPVAPELQPDHAVYCNFHYSGHLDDNGRDVILDRAPTSMVSVDGLRRRSDLNHRIGLNVLRTDASVMWQDDPFLLGALPESASMIQFERHNDLIRTLWRDPWKRGTAFWVGSEPNG